MIIALTIIAFVFITGCFYKPPTPEQQAQADAELQAYTDKVARKTQLNIDRKLADYARHSKALGSRCNIINIRKDVDAMYAEMQKRK